MEATEVLPFGVLLDDALTLPSGAEVGPYTIERVLGGGGTGVVYAARHTTSDARVALKVLRRELSAYPSAVARFMREFDAVRKIEHPLVAAVIEAGEIEPGRPYFAMELVEGRDLRRLLTEVERFTPAEALEIVAPLCEAVQAAHEAGVVHRDLKASNVLVCGGSGRTIRLVDFGIAKLQRGEAAAQGLTEPGTRVGTPHNMAPEQIRGEPVDARTDVYALGVLLYQLLTGEYPFDADDPRRIELLHLQAPAPRPSARVRVSPAIDAVVLRALEKAPALRYASARELASSLRDAVGVLEASPGEPCVALAVRARTTTSADDDLEDERVLDDMSDALDRLAAELSRRGFSLALRTASSLLAVRCLSEDEQADTALALDTERTLRRLVATRPDRDARVHIDLTAQVGAAERHAGSGSEPTFTGPLVDGPFSTDEA